MGSFGEAELVALYARLEKPVYNVVFRTIWDREEAHDVVQEAFARLWSMRRKIDVDRVEPLAYRIALNLARSWRRKQRVRAVFGLARPGIAATGSATGAPEGETAVDRVPDPTGDPESSADALRRALRLRDAIAGLPRDVRDVVLLTSFAEMSYGEIATALGVPEGTVASRRSRGLRLLREAMERSTHARRVHVARTDDEPTLSPRGRSR